MSALALMQYREDPPRKPPISAQYNWITGGVDIVPEQLELPLPPVDDAVLPDDGSVTRTASTTSWVQRIISPRHFGGLSWSVGVRNSMKTW
jgi:hypothetical protein